MPGPPASHWLPGPHCASAAVESNAAMAATISVRFMFAPLNVFASESVESISERCLSQDSQRSRTVGKPGKVGGAMARVNRAAIVRRHLHARHDEPRAVGNALPRGRGSR